MVYPDPRDPRDPMGVDPHNTDPLNNGPRLPPEADAGATFTWIAFGLVALIAFFVAASFIAPVPNLDQTVNNTNPPAQTAPPTKTQ